jgi:hypothetical protein
LTQCRVCSGASVQYLNTLKSFLQIKFSVFTPSILNILYIAAPNSDDQHKYYLVSIYRADKAREYQLEKCGYVMQLHNGAEHEVTALCCDLR